MSPQNVELNNQEEELERGLGTTNLGELVDGKGRNRKRRAKGEFYLALGENGAKSPRRKKSQMDRGGTSGLDILGGDREANSILIRKSVLGRGVIPTEKAG